MFKNTNEVETYFSLLQNSVGIGAVKNQKMEYMGSTHSTARLLGFNKQEDLVGKTDAELPCGASQSADLFQKHDHYVMQSNIAVHFLGFNQYKDSWRLLSSTKHPLRLINGDCVGIEVRTQDITSLGVLNAGVLLSDILSTHIKKRQAFYFAIQSHYHQINLSRQESLSSFYFFHGYTTKEIAKRMNVFPSTVETYLNRVKDKLNCSTRSQLIQKIHHLNLAQTLLI